MANRFFVLRFDGASSVGTGKTSAGAVLYEVDRPAFKTENLIRTRDDDEIFANIVCARGWYLEGIASTNNTAEYEGLVRGMEMAKELGVRYVRIQGDSELVIKQVKGQYKVKSPALVEPHSRAMRLSKEFSSNGAAPKIEYIARLFNKKADSLAQEAIKKKGDIDNHQPISSLSYDLHNDLLADSDGDDEDEEDSGEYDSQDEQSEDPQPSEPNIAELDNRFKFLNFDDVPMRSGIPVSSDEYHTPRQQQEPPRHYEYSANSRHRKNMGSRSSHVSSIPAPKDATAAWISQISRLAAYANSHPSIDRIIMVRSELYAMLKALDAEALEADAGETSIVSSLPPPISPRVLEEFKAGRSAASFKNGSMAGLGLTDISPSNFQIRYLAAFVSVCDGEYATREAELHARDRNWIACGDRASEGFEKIESVLFKLDDWLALSFDKSAVDGDSGAAEMSQASVEALGDLCHMSRNNSQNVRLRILDEGDRRRLFLFKKLEPQWQDRDRVKERMGEERWKNNTNRKGNYAEVRRELEVELRVLEKAMKAIEEMQFGNSSKR